MMSSNSLSVPGAQVRFPEVLYRESPSGNPEDVLIRAERTTKISPAPVHIRFTPRLSFRAL